MPWPMVLVFGVPAALLGLLFAAAMAADRAGWARRHLRTRWHDRLVRRRAGTVRRAAALAAEDDPAFEPAAVLAVARRLLDGLHAALAHDDAAGLDAVAMPRLAAQWRTVEAHTALRHRPVAGEPVLEHVGLVNRAGEDEDRVVVCATYEVEGRHGDGVDRRVDYLTLVRVDGAWRLEAVEPAGTGDHHLRAELIPTPWHDERVRDTVVTERGTTEALPPAADVAAYADLDFDGPVRSAAQDLALVDGRFDPDVIDAGVRRIVAAWATAVDGPETDLRTLAGRAAVETLLRPRVGFHLRVRGLHLRRLRVTRLDPAADPPSLAVEIVATGRRALVDDATGRVAWGSLHEDRAIEERWTLELSEASAWPWHLAAVDFAAAHR